MSIVIQLQKKCLDKNEDLQTLLREALVISVKLKLKDFKEWIEQELKGYENIDNIPSYRKVHKTLQFWNPYMGGYKTAAFSDAKLNKLFAEEHHVVIPISELKQICQADEDKVKIPIPAHIEKDIMLLFQTDFKPVMRVYKTQICAIEEQIRNILLEWTLKLEEDNILGSEELIFSNSEKEAAKNIHIENFNGVMGDITKLGNMSTGDNSNNTYNENNINNEIDNLISKIRELNLHDEEQIIIDLESSKNDTERAKSILGGLLSRGAEVASVSSAIIGILGLL